MNQDNDCVYTPNGAGDQDSKRLHTEWRWGPGQQAPTHRTALGIRTAQAPPHLIHAAPVPTRGTSGIR